MPNDPLNTGNPYIDFVNAAILVGTGELSEQAFSGMYGTGVCGDLADAASHHADELARLNDEYSYLGNEPGAKYAKFAEKAPHYWGTLQTAWSQAKQGCVE